MLLTDVYFFFSILPLAVLVSVAAFYWKQLWWVGLFGGLLWILLGLWGLTTYLNPVIANQRELSPVFIVVGIGVFLLPLYLNNKNNKSASEMITEIDEYGDEIDRHNKELEPYRKLRRKRFNG